ncbi:MAG: hypothetical protein LBI18_11705 [Planctomycetaceae bacterium]|nr:hypothetical protein [Planctomycetaceae bacterium]
MAKTLLIFLLVLVISLPISLTGCGGSKKVAAKKDYGKPVWLKVDESKFTPLSEDATNLENGTVTVYDPKGWERLSRGAVKAPKGFKSVIVFKKNGATIMMTKSQDAKGLPDLTEDNVEDFADGAQQKFKSPVKMIKLGNKVGVYFSRRVADAQRLSKYYDRRIVATTINGGLFTYELIADQGKINESLQNALFAVISKTQFENSTPEEDIAALSAPDSVPGRDTKPETITEIAKETKTETKPVADVTPKQVTPEPIAATATVATAETTTETKPAIVENKSTEKTSSDLVAKSGSPEKKSEPKKSESKKSEPQKPAAKKTTPKKGNTKDILNELDALLN